jgi:hypothetical protein
MTEITPAKRIENAVRDSFGGRYNSDIQDAVAEALLLAGGILNAEYVALLEEVTAWRECARYDPDMSGAKRFKGWDRSGLDRCRKTYIEER